MSFKILKNELSSFSNSFENNIKNVFSFSKNYSVSNFKKFNQLISKQFVSYSQQKKEIYKKYDIENELRFNFFESISDKWYRENFHSDILEAILNPKTAEIGNKEFLKLFMEFLDIPKEQFDYESDFVVIKEAPTGKIKWKDNQNNEREKEGYIDLLIKNEQQAIIIENKINYAPDMENQLVRYMKYVEENLKISNYIVVYLTLIDDKNKKPPLNSYDKDFKKYTEKLIQDNILREIYAVDPHKSIVKDFIFNCQNFLKAQLIKNSKEQIETSYNTAFVYLEQYKVLLNHLGGNAYMTTIDKKIFKEIYSDEELYNLVKDFAEIWKNKDDPKRHSDKKLVENINLNNDLKLAANDFMDLWNNRFYETVSALMTIKFQKNHPDKTLELNKINGSKVYSWLSLNKDYRIYWDGCFQIGYVSLENKTFSKTKEKILEDKLSKLIGKRMINHNNQWVWYDIPDNNFTSMDEVLKILDLLLKE